MNVAAIVGLRWISRSARIGAPAMLLWVLAWGLFFLPLAGAVTSSRAGIRIRAALRVDAPGARPGARVHLRLVRVGEQPVLLPLAAALRRRQRARRVRPLWQRRSLTAEPSRRSSSIGGLAFCLGLNLLGLGAGRWLQILGSVSNWIPAFLLIVAGIVALATVGSATNFAPANLLPREDTLGTISLWSALCFAFSGFELTSSSARRSRTPARTIPLGVVLGGVVVTVIYIAGSASLLVARAR